MGNYESVAHELRDRILKLIPSNQKILLIDDCWDLFKIDGFSCKGLNPTVAQAAWALKAAKEQYKSQTALEI